MIRKLACAMPLLALALSTGCLEGPGKQPDTAGVVYRHHFACKAEMARTTNATNLKKILALPASRELRDHVVQKLAKAPREFWQKEIPANAPDGAELLKPLLEDLFSAESYLEVRGPAKRPESVLAVKLDAQRAQLWSTNLWKLLSAWKLGVPTNSGGAGIAGWEWKGKAGSRLVRFVRSGEWVLVGLGEESFAVLPGFIEKLGKAGRPVPALTNSWFDLETDWPRLGQWFPLVAKHKLPPTQLTIAPFGEYVRTEGRLRYSEPIPWKYEPWKIPTNTITEPLISLTVARGIAPLLSQSSTIRDLGLKDLPNQFCLWGQAHEAAVTCLAVPMANARQRLNQLVLPIPKVVNAYFTNHPGNFLWSSNKSEILWEGLPFILPRVQAINEGGTEYLLADLFPMRHTKTNAPAELFDQFMRRGDLVYYDWEITGQRLLQARQLHQLYAIVKGLQFSGTNVPTQKWLRAIHSHLGNAVTEVAVVSPKELLLVRKSHLGFTGFELSALAHWIESSGFPLRYEAPPPLGPKLRKKDSSMRTNSLPRGDSTGNVNRSPPPKR